ncbi:MAG: YgjV family protein [Blautia sp.]|nr:YgjV family protein [Blautia sp.]
MNFDAKMIIEMVGYAGSLLVVVSMLMTSVKRLRIVNSIGSVIFMIYALIIKSYPTALMNFCLVSINVYQLIQLSKTERHFQMVEAPTGENSIQFFFDYYAEDIRKFFPRANKETVKACNTAYLVLCDAAPAGLLIGNKAPDGTLDICLDYSTLVYRDCSVGTYLYSQLPQYGIHRLTFSGESVDHKEYLDKMGFTQNNGVYVKEV